MVELMIDLRGGDEGGRIIRAIRIEVDHVQEIGFWDAFCSVTITRPGKREFWGWCFGFLRVLAR